MAERKLGTTTVRVALDILCSKLSKSDIISLLEIDPSTWVDLKFTGKCFKKTGSSTENITFSTRNDSIMLGSPQYGRNINLQQLGVKGTNNYITNQQYSIAIDDENYKNARIAIPDLNTPIDVYEHTEDYDPSSKGLRFDMSNFRPIDSLRMHLVYEDADDVTREMVLNGNMVKVYNCDRVIQFLQLGQSVVFDDKSQFSWMQQVGERDQPWWSLTDILTLASVSTYGYKYIDGLYSVNCRVYDDISKARNNDPAESENATDEQDETPAEDRTVVLFYTDKVSRTTFGQNDTADYFSHTIQFRVQYKTNEGEKIVEPKQAIVGYVKSSTQQSTFSNIEWVKHSKTKILDAKWTYGPEGGQKHSGKTPPNTTPDIMGFYDQVRIDNYNYRAKFGTNMLIFANRSDAERYLDGDLSVRPIYDGNSGRFDEQGDIGDKYIYNTQSYDISNEMSSVWILNKAQLDDLASVLATGLTKAEIGDELLLNITRSTARSFTALAEPVDMVCDLFWLPVSVTEFCNSHEDTMQFGEDTYGIIGTVDSVVDSATGAVYKANSTVERMNSKISDMMKDQMSRMLTEGIDVRVEEEPQPPSSN